MSALTQKRQSPRLRRTPLHGLHLELGARMVAFAGYEMALNYGPGILKEHRHTRTAAGLFDVSHMGQATLTGPDHEASAAALEALTPSSLAELGPGAMRYTLLLNDQGGIVDDLIVTRPALESDDGCLMLVVNADRKEADYAHLTGALPKGITLEPTDNRALIALQGPHAEQVLARHVPEVKALGFMTAMTAALDGICCRISRSGYTGEDGFEISTSAGAAEELARILLGEPEVEPIGLGARDSLRLEAGFCLYGHDLDETVTPVEAGLGRTVGKRRRRDQGFPGAARILRELEEGPARYRVGIRIEGRAPAREGAQIQDSANVHIGKVTSGGFSPTLGTPIAMGYVEQGWDESGMSLQLMVRGKAVVAAVADLPFVPHRYHRPTGS